MLGYFAIYSNNGSGWFGNSDTSSKQRRSIFGILPHEIAALNAQAADRQIRPNRQNQPDTATSGKLGYQAEPAEAAAS